jgi:ABC-type xylose transport system permease subunit
MSKIDESVERERFDEDLTEQAAREAELAVPAELVAGSLREYVRTGIARIRAGESGVLPVVAGLILISILFESLDSKFLTAGNLVNLLVQAAVFSLLAMGEVFVLLLGEIDLSIGYVAGLGAVIMADLAGPAHGWPWWSAITAALLATAGIGLVHGLIITLLGLPSFVVTLAGLLFWQGVLLKILGSGGTIPINSDVINNIASANLSPLAGWIVMLVLVALFGGLLWRRDSRRRRAGLVAPPPTVTLVKIGGALAGGVALVLLCNTDRGIFAPIQGVPWVVLLVVGVLVVWTIVLGRTTLGRYFYAIGGNAEAARRGDRGSRLRLTPAVDLDLDRRRHARPVRGGRCGHRRYEPVRRPRQGDPRRPRRDRHRGDRQRHGALGLHRRLEVHGHGARPPGRRYDRRTVAPRPCRRPLNRAPIRRLHTMPRRTGRAPVRVGRGRRFDSRHLHLRFQAKYGSRQSRHPHA